MSNWLSISPYESRLRAFSSTGVFAVSRCWSKVQMHLRKPDCFIFLVAFNPTYG
jgi:hypothetical protein